MKHLRNLISWHTFRHTHATLLSDLGEPLKLAQAQLGHADLDTTLQIYTHLIPDSQRSAVGRLERVLFPNVPNFEKDNQPGPEEDVRIQQERWHAWRDSNTRPLVPEFRERRKKE